MTRFVSPSRTLPLVLAIVLCAGAPLRADDHTPADRLLDAELIELTEGRIDAAVEIYDSILADPEITPSVRARTLFALARAQRKLGELGAAQRSYRALIDGHPDQAKLVKAAHRYLAEIEKGAQSLPEFNWVEQVEQNPEIQAQIFEWGMQLVSTAVGKKADPIAAVAWRKLLALGSTVVPVLEPMLKESTGSRHRKNLAEVLIRLGEWQHLPTLMDGYPRWGPSQLISHMEALGSDQKRQALIQVLALPPRDEWVEFRMDAQIALGDYDALESVLRNPRFDSWDLLSRHIDDPEIAARVRVVFEETKAKNLERYAHWIGRLNSNESSFVSDADWEVFLEDVEGRIGDVQLNRLMDSLGPDDPILHRFLASTNYRRLQNSPEMQRHHVSRIGWNPAAVSPELSAQIAYQSRYFSHLFQMSLEHEVAIPWLTRLIEERERPTGDAGVEMDRIIRPKADGQPSRTRSTRHGGRVTHGMVPISLPDSVQSALTESFSRSHPWGQSFILQVLTTTSPSATEKTKAFLRGLFGNRDLDPAVRVQVAVAQLELADRISADFASSVLSELTEAESRLRDSVLLETVRPIGSPTWSDVFPKDKSGWAGIELELGWVNLYVIYEEEKRSSGSTDRLAPEYWRRSSRFPTGLAKLFAQDPSPESIRLFNWLLELPRDARFDDSFFHTRLGLIRELGPDTDPAILRPVYNGFQNFNLSRAPSLGPWILDREIRVSMRNASIQVHNSDSDQLSRVDWSTLFQGDDPLLDAMPNPSFELSKLLDPHLAELRSANSQRVRKWAWNRSKDLTTEQLAVGLDDENEDVRAAAMVKILASEHVEVLPLLHRIMQDPDSPQRAAAITRVTAFAEEDSVRPLRMLLEDPMLSTRTAALEALQEIERIREERARWQIPDRAKRNPRGNR